MSCSSSYQLSRPCLFVILLSDTSSIQFQSLLFRITALPGCVAPFSSIGLNWSNMSCSSFYVQELKPQCRKELFSFIDVFVFSS